MRQGSTHTHAPSSSSPGERLLPGGFPPHHGPPISLFWRPKHSLGEQQWQGCSLGRGRPTRCTGVPASPSRSRGICARRVLIAGASRHAHGGQDDGMGARSALQVLQEMVPETGRETEPQRRSKAFPGGGAAEGSSCSAAGQGPTASAADSVPQGRRAKATKALVHLDSCLLRPRSGVSGAKSFLSWYQRLCLPQVLQQTLTQQRHDVATQAAKPQQSVAALGGPGGEGGEASGVLLQEQWPGDSSGQVAEGVTQQWVKSRMGRTGERVGKPHVCVSTTSKSSARITLASRAEGISNGLGGKRFPHPVRILEAWRGAVGNWLRWRQQTDPKPKSRTCTFQ